MTFKRTRTGCLTCREDGYKCDEKKPFCGRCIRLKKTCKGYGLKLKWQDPVYPQGPAENAKEAKDIRRRRSPPATAVVRRRTPSPVTVYLPQPMSSGLRPQHAYLLDHWSTTLASLITLAPTTYNQFHAHITPIIAHSTPLRSAVCSMAASHLSVLKKDPSLHTIATYYQTDAIASLRQNIATESPLVSLAIIMILQITDRLFTSSSGVNHLQGVKAIIERTGPQTWNCDAGAFLLNLFSYHDAVISVSRRTSPVLNLGDDVQDLEEMKPMRDLKTLWTTIGQISSMCSQSRTLLNHEGEAIERTLQELDAVASQDGVVGHTVHAYKEAAYIYLHRVWHNVGSPHPTTLKHAKDCLEHLFQVPVDSPLVTAHAWPLWTAACETVDATLRDLVRLRLKQMYDLRHLPSLQRLERDIEDVWRIKDKERTSTGVDKVDCIQAILGIRQRGADLV